MRFVGEYVIPGQTCQIINCRKISVVIIKSLDDSADNEIGFVKIERCFDKHSILFVFQDDGIVIIKVLNRCREMASVAPVEEFSKYRPPTCDRSSVGL